MIFSLLLSTNPLGPEFFPVLRLFLISTLVLHESAQEFPLFQYYFFKDFARDVSFELFF